MPTSEREAAFETAAEAVEADSFDNKLKSREAVTHGTRIDSAVRSTLSMPLPSMRLPSMLGPIENFAEQNRLPDPTGIP